MDNTDVLGRFEPDFLISTKSLLDEEEFVTRDSKQSKVIELSTAEEIASLGGDNTLCDVVNDEAISIHLFNFNPCHLGPRVILSSIQFPSTSGR